MPLTKSMLLCACIAMAHLCTAQPRRSFQWIGGPTGQANAPIKRFADPAPFDTSGIDLLLISHTHADHIDKEAKDFLNKSLTAIAPATESQVMVGWGFVHTRGLDWGNAITFNKAGQSLRIVAVEARHAVGEELNIALGKVNGYIIEYNNGHSIYLIYWTGDDVWFDRMLDLTKYGQIDLLIPDMGAVGANGAIGRRGMNSADCDCSSYPPLSATT